MPQRSVSRDVGISIAFCIVFLDITSINHITDSHKKYWSLQELYKGCDFYSIVEDYYKQHPEEAKEMRLKIYMNDGVIDEMTEGEAYDTGTKRLHSLEG